MSEEVTSADWDFMQRAEIMDKDADLVFVFGGTNDHGHGHAEMGSPDSRDPYTFCGAVHILTDYLIATYGKEKLCFILPLRRADEEREDGRTLAGYVNIIKSVLDEKEIPYLNVFENGLPKPLTRTAPDEFFIDGLHPNDKGHIWLCERVVEYVKSLK